MLPAISQVCSLNSPFEKDIEDYAAGACHTIELWLGKLDTYLQSHSLDDVRQLLAAHEVTAPVASYQGGLLSSQGEPRQAAWDLFAKRLQQCRELNVQTLVVAADIRGQLDSQDIDRIRMSLTQAAAQAGEAGVRLALEFQAPASLANNLETAAALVEECGSPHLGICLDAFHFFTGPSKFDDLGYLTPDNLFHVQMSDVLGVPRELAADSDRILPGEGDFNLPPLVAALATIGYAGCVSIELMNPQIWRIPARQFGEVALTALRKLLGQASMG